ncbi:magnesium transporter, partial [Dimargaris cristalligena]
LPYYRRPLWLAGFALFLASSFGGSTVTISLLPVTILAPLGAVTLVSNALFAKWLLADPFSVQAFLATILVVLGGLLIGIFGALPLPSHDLASLITLYQRPAFIAFFTVTEVLVLALLGVIYLLGVQERRAARYPPHRTMIRGLLYGIVSGMLCSQSLLFAKSGIELLIVTLQQGNNQFTNPLAGFILLALVVTSLSQLYFLNRSLELCSTLVIAPLTFCSYNLSTLLNGLIYYDQFQALAPYQLALVLVGAVILSIGVCILSV